MGKESDLERVKVRDWERRRKTEIERGRRE